MFVYLSLCLYFFLPFYTENQVGVEKWGEKLVKAFMVEEIWTMAS